MLSRRHKEILDFVVRRYVEQGAPVGSKAIAQRFTEPVSSATVRNVMAELEVLGYLSHPHTSAGRVPTDKAYRHYVDSLEMLPALSDATSAYIEDYLQRQLTSADDLMARISRLLAEVSQHMGVVLGPARGEKLLEHIKFVRLPGMRALAVMVSKPDVIENKVFTLEQDFTQEELDRTADYLNQEFRGWSLRTIRLELIKRMEALRSFSDRLLSNIATLFMWGAMGEEEPASLFVDGAARMAGRPDMMEAGGVSQLLEAVEHKAKIIQILDACLNVSSAGVRALIGQENPNAEMRQCTFIVAPYRYRERTVGVLGVIGPKRMEYELALSTVEFVARVTTRLLSAN